MLFWKSIKGGCHILSSLLRGVDEILAFPLDFADFKAECTY